MESCQEKETVRASDQTTLIHRLLDHLRAETTQLSEAPLRVPASHYASDNHLERELSTVFREGPSVVGLTADARAPGDYFSAEVAGFPLLVVRGTEGRLRAFANACRHRGGRLAQGRGCFEGSAIRCPVHAWTYDLEGCLTHQPNARGGFEKIDPGTLGLRELPCTERNGLVAVHPQADGRIAPEHLLEEFADDFQSFDLPGLHAFASRRQTWRCNWKLVLETFLESYHVFSLHRDSVNEWYLSHPMVFDEADHGLRFPVVRRSIEGLLDTPESTWDLLAHATIQYWFAPASLLAFTWDHWMLWRVEPTAANSCVTEVTLYTSENVTEETKREHFERTLELHLRVAGSEDFPSQERVQQALSSGASDELVVGQNELAVGHFHRTLQHLLEARGRPASAPTP